MYKFDKSTLMYRPPPGQSQPLRRSNARGQLEGLVFDVLLVVLSILDVMSIVRLAMVSRRLRGIIRSERSIWIRALQSVMREECLMPYTFDLEFMSITELERCATRPLRLHHHILHQRVQSLSSRIFEPDFSHINVPHPFEWTNGRPHLLPGGRWLLSYAWNDSYLYILAYDLRALHGTTSRLKPTSYIRLSKRDAAAGDPETWPTFITQSDPTRDRVLILVGYQTYLHGMDQSVHELIHLTWPDMEDRVPSFERGPFLVDPVTDASPGGRVTLEGELVCIHSSDRRLILWNWKRETWAIVDLGTTIPAFFDLWQDPPRLYAAPHDMAPNYVYIIPPLQSVSQPCPVHDVSASYQFPSAVQSDDEAPSIQFYSHTVFDAWKPVAMRRGQLCGSSLFNFGSYKILLQDLSFFQAPRASVPSGSTAQLQSLAPSVIFSGGRNFGECSLYTLPSDLLVSTKPALSRHSVGTWCLELQTYRSPSYTTRNVLLPTDLPLNHKAWMSATLCTPPCFLSGTFVVSNSTPDVQSSRLHSILTFD